MLWSPNSLHYTNSPHTHHILYLILYTNYEPIASTCQIFSFFTPHLSLSSAPPPAALCPPPSLSALPVPFQRRRPAVEAPTALLLPRGVRFGVWDIRYNSVRGGGHGCSSFSAIRIPKDGVAHTGARVYPTRFGPGRLIQRLACWPPEFSPRSIYLL